MRDRYSFELEPNPDEDKPYRMWVHHYRASGMVTSSDTIYFANFAEVVTYLREEFNDYA